MARTTGAGIFTAVILLSAAAHAATRNVSTGGVDSGDCVSSPCRTITYAYAQAGSGDTVLVASGVYTDYQTGWGLHLHKTVPIVVRAATRWGAILDGQNASDRNDVIFLDGSNQTIEGFEIRNGLKGGLSIWGDANRLISNHIHDNGRTGPMTAYGQDGAYSDAQTSGNQYIGNYVHHNGRLGVNNLDHGFYLCGKNELVANNVLASNTAWGLQIAGYTTVRSMRVYNNVMTGNGHGGIVIWQAMDGVDIKNNIIVGNSTHGIDSWDAHGAGVVIDHNVVYGNPDGDYNFTGGGSDYTYQLRGTINADPAFVNPGGGDFHLKAGSPAIDTGLAVSGVTEDFEGTTRPQGAAWDIGPYERCVAPCTVAPADGGGGDAGSTDAGAPEAGGVDGGVDGGAGAGSPPPRPAPADGGCGCALAGRAGGGVMGVAALGALLGLRIVRRKRRAGRAR